MRFRLGFVSGFAAGYYLGTKAGRERYAEIQRTLDKVRSTEVYETASTKAKAVVDEGVDKVKDKAKELTDRGSNTDAADTSTDGTATVPTAVANPAAAPDGAGTVTAGTAENP